MQNAIGAMHTELTLLEPQRARYIYVCPETNHVFLLLPIVGGDTISTDNTCQSVIATSEFFDKTNPNSAYNSLQKYQAALNFDLLFVDKDSAVAKAKQQRLEQINGYLQAIEELNAIVARQPNHDLHSLKKAFPEYPDAISAAMISVYSNVYAIHLRPSAEDEYIRSKYPIFAMPRLTSKPPPSDETSEDANDTLSVDTSDATTLDSTSLESLDTALSNPVKPEYKFYERLTTELGKTKNTARGARKQFTEKVLESSAARNKDFSALQAEMVRVAENLYGEKINFRQIADQRAAVRVTNKQLAAVFAVFQQTQEPFNRRQVVDILIDENPEDLFNLYQRYIAQNPEPEISEEFIRMEMGLREEFDSEEFIDYIIGYCAPHLFDNIVQPPFFAVQEQSAVARINELNILTQFFLAQANIYALSERIIGPYNFAEVLSKNENLSAALIDVIVQALQSGAEVETSILEFINAHHRAFYMQTKFTQKQCQDIIEKFRKDYITIKDADHFDEFIIFDERHNGLFVRHQGAICLDFACVAEDLGLKKAPETAEIHEMSETTSTQIYASDSTNEFLQQAQENYKQVFTSTNRLKPINELETAKINVTANQLINSIQSEQFGNVFHRLSPKTQQNLLKKHPEIQTIATRNSILIDLAHGRQQEVQETLANNPENLQTLLLSPFEFTDPSGRTFNCSAVEYAFWARDIFMLNMLQQYFDEEISKESLKQIENVYYSGITYSQNGASYQSSGFDYTELFAAYQSFEAFNLCGANLTADEKEQIFANLITAQGNLPANVVNQFCDYHRDFNEESFIRCDELLRTTTCENLYYEEADWYDFTDNAPYERGEDKLVFATRQYNNFEIDCEGFKRLQFIRDNQCHEFTQKLEYLTTLQPSIR